MDRIGFYEFEGPETLKKWKEMGDVFYKGNGLKSGDVFEDFYPKDDGKSIKQRKPKSSQSRRI